MAPSGIEPATFRLVVQCLNRAINTHSKYVILTAFTLQQWLHESASALSCGHCLPDLKLVCEWNSHICGIIRSFLLLLVLLFQKTNDGWTSLKTPTRLYLWRWICCVVQSLPLRHAVLLQHCRQGDEWQDMRQSFRRHYRRRADVG